MNEPSICIPGASAPIENTARSHIDEVLVAIVPGDSDLIATIRHSDALVGAHTPIVGVRAIDHAKTGETDASGEPESRLYPHLPETRSTVEAGDNAPAIETIHDDPRLTQPAHHPGVVEGRRFAMPPRPKWTTVRARALVVA